jgi:hypothetical protein
MRKAMLFFLAAIGYMTLFNWLKPALSEGLGDSVRAHWILVVVFIVPVSVLLRFFMLAMQNRHPHSELEKNEKSEDRMVLLLSGRLSLRKC